MYTPFTKPFIYLALFISTTLVVHKALPSSQALPLCTSVLSESTTVHGNSTPRLSHDIANQEKELTTIPNIVHFVHLIKDTQRQGGPPMFEFEFRHFIAMYSPWHFLKPETIYVHTNIEDDIIQRELATSINPYTQAIGKIPKLEFVHCTPPTNTTSGQKIDALANMSDFIRTDALIRYGGIFLDEDSYVLRDLAPLRRNGFENVIGRQADGQICPAILLSTRDNRLMKAYHALQDVIFDGVWDTHATYLLSTLAKDFSPIDSQVLVLEQDAFFPSSWAPEDVKELYGVRDDVGQSSVNNPPLNDLQDFINNFQLTPPANTWHRDWRLSYALHGWTSTLPGGRQSSLSAADNQEIFGAFGGISLPYVLARNSNFSLAVYPAVKHALDHGFLDGVRSSVAVQEATQQQKELGGVTAG